MIHAVYLVIIVILLAKIRKLEIEMKWMIEAAGKMSAVEIELLKNIEEKMNKPRKTFKERIAEEMEKEKQKSNGHDPNNH